MSGSQPDGKQFSPRVRALMGLIRPADQPRVMVSVVEDGNEADEQAPVLNLEDLVEGPQPGVVIIVVVDEDTPPM